MTHPACPDATGAPAQGLSRNVARGVERLGLWRSTALLTLAVWVLALIAAQLMISLLGRGDRIVALASASALSLLLAPLPGLLLLRLVIELEQARQRIAMLTTRDPLTGLAHRCHFLDAAEREWERARRYGNDAALLLIDVDQFHCVNGEHGHLCGDELLRRIAAATAASLRQPDLLARFGSEELIVFLPQTDPLGALDVAERIRMRVQALRLPWQGVEVGTTVSVGVVPLRSDLSSLDAMIRDADVALRAAKTDGRNCVRTLPFEAGSRNRSRTGGSRSGSQARRDGGQR